MIRYWTVRDKAGNTAGWMIEGGYHPVAPASQPQRTYKFAIREEAEAEAALWHSPIIREHMVPESIEEATQMERERCARIAEAYGADALADAILYGHPGA